MGHEIDIDKGEIVISFNKNSEELSSSGKSVILASSRGFVWDGDTGIGVSYNIVRRVSK